jgi:hypothetical protein
LYLPENHLFGEYTGCFVEVLRRAKITLGGAAFSSFVKNGSLTGSPGN